MMCRAALAKHELKFMTHRLWPINPEKFEKMLGEIFRCRWTKWHLHRYTHKINMWCSRLTLPDNIWYDDNDHQRTCFHFVAYLPPFRSYRSPSKLSASPSGPAFFILCWLWKARKLSTMPAWEKQGQHWISLMPIQNVLKIRLNPMTCCHEFCCFPLLMITLGI